MNCHVPFYFFVATWGVQEKFNATSFKVTYRILILSSDQINKLVSCYVVGLVLKRCCILCCHFPQLLCASKFPIIVCLFFTRIVLLCEIVWWVIGNKLYLLWSPLTFKRYTSSNGERRIRVHTMAAPVVAELGEMYRQADTGAIVSLLSRLGKLTYIVTIRLRNFQCIGSWNMT